MEAIYAALKADGAQGVIVGPHLGLLEASGAVEAAKRIGDSRVFIAEACKHGKAIAATGEGVDLIAAALPEGAEGSPAGQVVSRLGIVTLRDSADWVAAARELIAAISKHRRYDRMDVERMPA